MTVGEVLSRLDEFDEEMTIYAELPFNLSSEAVVDLEPEVEPEALPSWGGTPLPEQAQAKRLHYLLEVHVAKDVISNLSIPVNEASADLKLRAVLHYRQNDAYMEPVKRRRS